MYYIIISRAIVLCSALKTNNGAFVRNMAANPFQAWVLLCCFSTSTLTVQLFISLNPRSSRRGNALETLNRSLLRFKYLICW